MFAKLSALATAVTTNVAPVLSELKKNVTTIIEEEQKEYNTTQAEYEERKRKILHKPVSYPLWSIWNEDKTIQEAELKQRILRLASDLSTFQVSPVGHSDFNFECYTSLCEEALANDQLLATRRYRLVPRKLSESQFWYYYLSKVDDIRRDMDLPLLLEHPQKQLELKAKGIIPDVDNSPSSSSSSLPLSSSSSSSSSSSASHGNVSDRKDTAASLSEDMNAFLADSEEEYVKVGQASSSSNNSSSSNSGNSSPNPPALSSSSLKSKPSIPVAQAVVKSKTVSAPISTSSEPTAAAQPVPVTSSASSSSSFSASPSHEAAASTEQLSASSSTTSLSSSKSSLLPGPSSILVGPKAVSPRAKVKSGSGQDADLLELEDMLSELDVDTTAPSTNDHDVGDLLLDEDLA